MKLKKKSNDDVEIDVHHPAHPRYEADTVPIDRYGKTPSRRRWNILAVHIIWWTFAIIFLGTTLFFTLIYHGVIGNMPDIEQLKNPIDRYASVVYTADGVEMGRYFPQQGGNRVYVDYNDISDWVIKALVATEDERFEEHSGIDFRALIRVLGKTFIMRNPDAGGGSTITQQLAKQLYSEQSTGLLARAKQKPIEWMIAIKLERYFSKEEIIKMYLNQFDFLHNAVGIQSAAEVYFDKPASDLNIQESAMLVGMVKNPRIYNPVSHPEAALERRNVVLNQMVKSGYLASAEADSLKALPVELNLHKVNNMEGIAPYFRVELRRILTAKKPNREEPPYFMYEYNGKRYYNMPLFYADSAQWVENPVFGWIEKNPKKDGTKYNLDTDGLQIYTTIDSRMQRYAEEAVNEHLRDLQKKFFAEKRGQKNAPYTSNQSEISSANVQALINRAIKDSGRYHMHKAAGLTEDQIMAEFTKPQQMKVFSYAGMRDTVMTPRDSILYYKSYLRAGFMSMEPSTGHVKAYVGGPDFQHFQYDMVSTGRRQIGSTMKPFLYALAMDEGYTPCDVMLNEQPSFRAGNGKMWSPRGSGNGRTGEYVTLKWALTNSNNWISARLINAIGPQTLVRYLHNFGVTGNIPSDLALCLGPHEVSVLEMVGGYSAFANEGMRSVPIFVTAITDHNGNIISEFRTTHHEVLSKKGYYKTLDMLLNVVNQGTGSRLRRAPFSLTSEMGGKTGTTNYNSDAWFMGFTPQLVSGVWVGGEDRYIHFSSMANGQGAAAALPIYGKYMKKVYADPTLPYRPTARFEFPADLDLCADGKSNYQPVDETTDVSISDAFE